MSCFAKYTSRSVTDLFILNYQQLLTSIPCSTSNPMELTLISRSWKHREEGSLLVVRQMYTR
jgi:hypothetical protein